MIKIEHISDNVFRITAPQKLQAEDFRDIAPQFDSFINKYGKVRLLIDASGFDGWENKAALENHTEFVKRREERVERIAVIAGHEWQRWVVGLLSLFLHPKIKIYEKKQEGEALQWIAG